MRRGVEVANAELPGGVDRRLRLGVGDFAVEVAELRAAEGELAQDGASVRQLALGDGAHLTRTYDVSRWTGSVLRPASPSCWTGTRSRRPARLASVVLEELAHQIIGGTLPEGSVLPTEPALCEQFGFSRTVIREGLKQLEERGLVRVEQGRGTTVQPRDSWNLLDPAVIRIALAYDQPTCRCSTT